MIGLPTYLGWAHASLLVFLSYAFAGGAAMVLGELLTNRPDHLRDLRGASTCAGLSAASILSVGGAFFLLSLWLI